MHNVHTATLITITGSVSLPQPGLELILLVGGTFTDALSQTDHNCFFIKVACCSKKKKKMTNRRGKKTKTEKGHFTLHITNTQKHIFSLCPHFLWSLQQALQWYSQLAVNIRTALSSKTFRCALPNPSAQTSGAGQPHNVSTQPGPSWSRTPSASPSHLLVTLTKGSE